MYKPELLSYSLGAHVCAFSTMRGGGYSSGAYATFNANAYCGDDERHVALNRVLLCDELGLSADRLIIPHQVHGDRVLRIDDRFFAGDEAARGAALEGADAVMTDLPHVCVSVSTADCIPVLVYDSRHHAVAAVHAGWRGTMLRIVETTLGAMHEAYGTEPSDVQAVIGPGISLDAFEVGDEVYEAFAVPDFPWTGLRAVFRCVLLQGRLYRKNGISTCGRPTVFLWNVPAYVPEASVFPASVHIPITTDSSRHVV